MRCWNINAAKSDEVYVKTTVNGLGLTRNSYVNQRFMAIYQIHLSI